MRIEEWRSPCRCWRSLLRCPFLSSSSLFYLFLCDTLVDLKQDNLSQHCQQAFCSGTSCHYCHTSDSQTASRRSAESDLCLSMIERDSKQALCSTHPAAPWSIKYELTTFERCSRTIRRIRIYTPNELPASAPFFTELSGGSTRTCAGACAADLGRIDTGVEESSEVEAQKCR